jgi:Tol biopolymer transport system component
MVPRCFFLLIVCLLLSHAFASAGITERVSVSSTGEEGNGYSPPDWFWWSGGRKVSADGRYVVFASDASNLVPGDDNGRHDAFLRDRVMELTYCLSVTPTEAVSNKGAWEPVISADGRYVAFESSSTNLVAGDTNGRGDIFVRDIELGVTELVSVSTSGEQGSGYYPSISADGRYVVFLSSSEELTTEGEGGVFLRDRQLNTTELVSFTSWGSPVGHGGVHGRPHVSADGRFVCFTGDEYYSLVPWDTNDCTDVFVRDRVLGTTYRVSTGSYGEQGNGDSWQGALSADGRFVAFVSEADNLVPGDTNGYVDVFIRNLESGETVRASVDAGGNQVYCDSGCPSLSADGRFVSFWSGASELVPGHTPTWRSIFVRDTETGAVEIATVSSTGEPAEHVYRESSLSADGRYVVFISGASNVVPGDTNESRDVFIRDRQTFDDVSVGHWGYYAIDACCDGGLVAGYPDGNYRPDWAVTRDQMAVYISRGVAGGDDSVPPGPAEATFPDVSTMHWAFDHVEYAVARSIVEGYEDGSYRPDLDVTRGQMAVFIARAIADPTGEEGLTDYQPPEVPSYPDVPADYWSYKHVEYLAQRDVVQGYPDGMYRPTATVTRDQMAVYIARAFGLM